MACPFPLAEGVSTITGGVQDVTLKFEVSTMELMAKAEPVSRWHQVQWQQLVTRGGARMV
jgi:hypothetical protein